jgi:UDP-arabinose 4-epimerase
MDFGDARRKPNFAGKVAVAVALTVMCILVLKQSPGFGGTSVVCANSLPHQLDYVTLGCWWVGIVMIPSIWLNFNILIQVPHGTLV